MNEVLSGDDIEKKKIKSIKNQQELNAKISNEFAPKLAEQAVSEALNLGSSKLTGAVTTDQKTEMKNILAAKIKTKKTDNVAIQT
jgi:predicted adenine nucleotide alpha hydrolase (AANH) superfamily ATPase